MRTPQIDPQLFTIRMWPEEMREGRLEWRGKIQYLANGEALYFREWEALVAFLRGTLDASAAESDHLIQVQREQAEQGSEGVR